MQRRLSSECRRETLPGASQQPPGLSAVFGWFFFSLQTRRENMPARPQCDVDDRGWGLCADALNPQSDRTGGELLALSSVDKIYTEHFTPGRRSDWGINMVLGRNKQKQLISALHFGNWWPHLLCGWRNMQVRDSTPTFDDRPFR